MSLRHSSEIFNLQGRPLLRDHTNFTKMVDPLLEGHYPHLGLRLAFAVAIACLEENPDNRPDMKEVSETLDFICSQKCPKSQ